MNDQLQEQYQQLLQRAEADGGRYPAPVVGYRDGKNYVRFIAYVFKFKHEDAPSEWYCVEVDEAGAATAVKRICNY